MNKKIITNDNLKDLKLMSEKEMKEIRENSYLIVHQKLLDLYNGKHIK